MTRLTRHVLAELLKVFVLALAAMTTLMLLVGVVREAASQGLGPGPILKLIPYVLPDALRFTVPGTVLFAVCSVYGRMAAANEVTAVKSLGISPLVLVWPTLGLAFVLSIVAVWLNDIAVSWGRAGIQRVVIHSVEQVAYGMLRTNQRYSDDRFTINVKDVQGRRLVLPIVTLRTDPEKPPVTISAREAELDFIPERESLRILLTYGQIQYEDKLLGTFPDTLVREISLGSARTGSGGLQSPSNYPLGAIPKQIEFQRSLIGELEKQLAVAASYQLFTGDFQALRGPEWDQHHAELQLAKARLNRLRTEPWRRWASGFSCLFFVLAGAPTAIRLRTADVWTTFFFCFMPILIVYYPFFFLGLDWSKGGNLPPYAVWLGNAALLLAGMYQLHRVRLH